MKCNKRHIGTDHDKFTDERLKAIGGMLDLLTIRDITFHPTYECGCGLTIHFTPVNKVQFSTLSSVMDYVAGMLYMQKLSA